ncbi:hypothetical protein ABIB58_002444 [Brevundimonas sp. UYEF29]
MVSANRAEVEKNVFVHAYVRLRYGKTEWVTAHYRSWPRG